MKINIITPAISLFLLLSTNALLAQTSAKPMQSVPANIPWTDRQLIEPGALANIIADGKTGNLIIYNIGAVGDIKGAIHIGPVSNHQNMVKLNTAVATLPKNTVIVIYCGCCPFSKCPNAGPAFTELNKKGFLNVKLLNLPKNLQSDWIAKHYPMALN